MLTSKAVLAADGFSKAMVASCPLRSIDAILAISNKHKTVLSVLNAYFPQKL